MIRGWLNYTLFYDLRLRFSLPGTWDRKPLAGIWEPKRVFLTLALEINEWLAGRLAEVFKKEYNLRCFTVAFWQS